MIEDPFYGIGKPEPLRYALSGFLSRRNDKGYRIIYEVTDIIV
jgi:toxin YoeB